MATTILLVEDDTLLGRTISGYFEKAGFGVFWARESVEVFEALEAQPIDLVLLDIMLPGMNGVEILRKIRQMPGKETLPIVMLTNLSGMESVDQAMAAGATDYIVKANIELSDLVELVKTKYLGGI